MRSEIRGRMSGITAKDERVCVFPASIDWPKPLRDFVMGKNRGFVIFLASLCRYGIKRM